MTAYALYHSSELNMDAHEQHYHDPMSGEPQEDFDVFIDGWYVCPSIPEGAIIDHRMRGLGEQAILANRINVDDRIVNARRVIAKAKGGT